MSEHEQEMREYRKKEHQFKIIPAKQFHDGDIEIGFSGNGEHYSTWFLYYDELIELHKLISNELKQKGIL